jgi:mono/diheme cytochrome c family protein
MHPYGTLVALAAFLNMGCHDVWRSVGPNAHGDPASGDGPASPSYGVTTSAASPPPPISGGTLLIARDGHTAIAADPDRDSVWIVDLPSGRVKGEVKLTTGDEPGRVVEGIDGRVHIVLRRGGALAMVDTAGPMLVARHPVCPAPRGVVYEPGPGVLHVACAGGELITLHEADGMIVRTVHLDRDLRDVVLLENQLRVSRFRSAEVLTLGTDGTVISRTGPRLLQQNFRRSGNIEPADAALDDPIDHGFEPDVAWRMISARKGVMMVHQYVRASPVSDDGTDPGPKGGGGYGTSGCGQSIVNSAVTLISGSAASTTTAMLNTAVLPVDIAVARTINRIVAVAAGNAHIAGMPQLFEIEPDQFRTGRLGCSVGTGINSQPDAQAVAAAFDGADHLVVQTREPPALYLIDERRVIHLAKASRADTGHSVFHSNTGFGIACASCHPEGGDDGRVWTFVLAKSRRTQNLRGGILGTEPFHWAGELRDMPDLAGTVFSHRMGGPTLKHDQVSALAHWIDSIPAVPIAPPTDPAAATRGRQLFHDPVTACATCHAGPSGTDNRTIAVGTGLPFQTPRLRSLAERAPYMHNGCAATLTDRFGPCGGGDAHGRTSHLTPAQIADLVAYLETL